MNKNTVFYTDNYAYGRISEEVLANVNAGAYAILGECWYFEDVLQREKAKGARWIYSNSNQYSPQQTSFDEMVVDEHPGTNCAMPAGWAYIDLGVCPYPKRFWGDRECGMANYDTLAPNILKAADITHWEEGKPFGEYFEAGEIKPGDVLLAKGHTFIYMGDELFMAAGHDGKWHADETVRTDDPRKAVFDSWVCDMRTNYDWRCNVYWRLRFRDEYVPAFYRGKDGKLKENK